MRALPLPAALLALCCGIAPPPAALGPLMRADGVRVAVSADDADPILHVTLPGRQERAIEIIFPEHVTARRHGANEILLFRGTLDDAQRRFDERRNSL